MGKVGAIILAAGSSERMRGGDKMFASIAGKPLLAYSVEVFQHCATVNQLVIVLSERNFNEGRTLTQKYHWSKVSTVCLGGRQRQDSVRKGLSELSGCEWIVVHDGARPCITQDMIEMGLAAAKQYGAAIAAIPVSDTIKIVSPELFIEQTPVRQRLWAAQTPQVFRFDIISEAHQKAEGYTTDDAALVENLGYRIKVYNGSESNIKVTTPEDLILVEAILTTRGEGS